MMHKRAASLLLVLVLILVVSLPAVGQTSRTRFAWVIADKLTVNEDASVGDDLTVSDDATVADDATIGGLLTHSAADTITVTDGSAFEPTGSYQPITAAGEVTPTVTVGSAGQVVMIVNVGSNTINLADTGTAKLTAAFAMGQYDSLSLISDGTNWIELARANN